MKIIPVLSWLVLAAFLHNRDTVMADPPSAREANRARALAQDERRLRDYAGSPGMLARPGLLADRTGRVVRVTAEAIHLNPGSPVEFPLITLNSGKDYEALAVSFASGLDIHEALQFIGLTPGHGVDASKLQFWARGDRVQVMFHYRTGASNEVRRSVPAERLVIDTRTSKPLPEAGFVFTGSEWLPALEPATGRVYAADAFSPGSLVSVYNDSATVLDVPRRADQGAVYSYQVPNPEFLLPSNQLVEITLEPFFQDGRPHELDLALEVAPRTPGTTEPAYRLRNGAGQPLSTNTTATGLLATLERHAAGDQAVFVTLHIADTASLATVLEAARLLSSLDREEGIRIEPPPAGHPYYKAFLPNPRFRDRAQRPSPGVELYLANAAGTTTGQLVQLEMQWKGDDSEPSFRETRIPAPTPAALEQALEASPETPAALLVFAPKTLDYGTFRKFAAPLLKRNAILYVFGE